MENKSFTIDLNTNPSFQNINTSPVPSETLDEELIMMRKDNKKLATMLKALCENYNSLQNHIIELQKKFSSHNEEDMKSKLLLSRKRKAEEMCCLNNSEVNFEEASPKRPREITTHISTVVKDGYNWRKYGRATRDNLLLELTTSVHLHQHAQSRRRYKEVLETHQF
ncbi:hypothetical protein HAX54_012862 [Datura stramonium]|uniref:WRKY domain-containing protein n=1 Tax=Datura stramonium TaxID=4076 RepID=A0ABS8Y1H1_DATST|nr:hypothetical protein [Datura stramonium]